MSWLDLAYRDEAEQIDQAGVPEDDLTRSMADVASSNHWFGATATILRNIAAVLRDNPPSRTISVLDIGTGSGDIPRALATWGAKRGVAFEITASDRSADMLGIARRARTPAHLVQADALSLPFPPKSFDIVLCSLTLHHIGLEGSATVLAQADRIGRMGFVISDLRRDRLSLAAVSTGLALMRAHPITRHDGPASVRRAFSLREYGRLIAVSGVNGVRVSTPWYFRVVMVRKHAPAQPLVTAR